MGPKHPVLFREVVIKHGDTIKTLCGNNIAIYDNDINTEFRHLNQNLKLLVPGTKIIIPEGDKRRTEDLLRDLPKNTTAAEIGVYEGDSSSIILRETSPKKLYMIDCWRKQPYEEYSQKINELSDYEFDELYLKCIKRLKKEICEGQVIILRGLSQKLYDFFDNHSLDIIYIDGNHSYSACYADLINYYPKIKPGGLIWGKSYRNWKYSENYYVRIKDAVDDFVKNYNVTLEAVSFIGFGWYLIRC